MKLWWLKLYTLPKNKNILEFFAGVLIVEFLICTFNPEFGMSLFPTYFGIFLGVSMTDKADLYHHMDFHKLSVEKKPLIKIFFLDFAFHYCFKLVVLFSCLYISNKFLGLKEFTSKLGSVDFLGLLGTPSLMFVFISWTVAFSFCFRYMSAFNREKLIDYKGMNLWYKVIFSLGLLGFYKIVNGLLLEYSNSVLLLMIFCSCIWMLTIVLYKSLAIFDLEKKEGNLRLFFKFHTAGLFASFFIFSLSYFAFIGLESKNATQFSPLQRYMTFNFWGKLSPVLELNDFKTYANYPMPSDLVYSRAPANIGSFPVEMIFEKESLIHFQRFLEKTNPSTNNILYISNQLKNFDLDKERESSAVVDILVKKWPKGIPLHQTIVDYKSKHEVISRNLASEKRIKAKHQELDRY